MAERSTFSSLKEVFAKANEEKSGDRLAGIASRSEQERIAAKCTLADLPLRDIIAQPLIPLETDEVSRLLQETWDEAAFQPISALTVGEFREYLLDDLTTDTAIKALRWGITPEIAAAVAKLMSNRDIVLAASRIRNVTRCRNTMGEQGVLGIRLQPNHPADDPAGILLATIEGLLYGCGDAVIGVNPATDSVEAVSSILHAVGGLIEAYQIPTHSCCLAHITTQLQCLECGAPIDLLFQSIAGTEAANRSFGITLDLLREGRERVLEHHSQRGVAWVGTQVMYFETGQGSARFPGLPEGNQEPVQADCCVRCHSADRPRFLVELPNLFLWNQIRPELLECTRRDGRAVLQAVRKTPQLDASLRGATAAIRRQCRCRVVGTPRVFAPLMALMRVQASLLLSFSIEALIDGRLP
jgi:ethanolamine ammonia-lyase large subunit